MAPKSPNCENSQPEVDIYRHTDHVWREAQDPDFHVPNLLLQDMLEQVSGLMLSLAPRAKCPFCTSDMDKSILSLPSKLNFVPLIRIMLPNSQSPIDPNANNPKLTIATKTASGAPALLNPAADPGPTVVGFPASGFVSLTVFPAIDALYFPTM